MGPQSAGADPGPACYGRGGTSPTVTDAAVVLGYIDPERFLGGRMTLDREAAVRVVGELAGRLGMGVEQAASAILTLSGEEMVKAIDQITVKDGVDPSESLVVAGGGAAGLNVVPIARSLGCRQVLVPRTAGALSACGAQHSDIVVEFSGSRYSHSDEFDHDGVNEVLAGIDARMDAFAARLSARGIDEFTRERFVEARYLNQQWEMEVLLPLERFGSAESVTRLRAAFDEQHERLYEVRDDKAPLECVNWKGRLTARLPKPRRPEPAAGTGEARPDTTVTAYFDETGAVETPVYLGGTIPPGTVLEAPAIVVEPTTTIVVHPGSRCLITDTGNYLLEVEPARSTAPSEGGVDPVLLAVMANRLDAILREMTETVLLTARSSVIGMARDFSCGINTSSDEVLAIAAGLPMHVFGTHLQCAAMRRTHPEFREGDAYIHNDPYDGNSHAADHTILVPVFHEGEHVFTVTVKSHQADTGNSIPTTYHAGARDVYEEGR
ncbi:MAG: hydantoinase/oxoprolinase family protein [Thermoleophilia bacterium]